MMENNTLNPVQQKHIARFIVTFLPENRNTSKIYKTEFFKIATMLMYLIEVKSGYTANANQINSVFNMLRYTITTAETVKTSAAVQRNSLFIKQAFLNIEPIKVEGLSLLVKHLQGAAKPGYMQRVQELNLQVDIFNKLYPLQVKAA